MVNHTVEITGKEQFLEELEKDWKAIDRGEQVTGSVHRLYFESAETLSKILTKQRHNLLKTLHAHGALTVHALAALLERNYKNVHQDVKILEESGLIERDAKNHIHAPYEKLTIELSLIA